MIYLTVGLVALVALAGWTRYEDRRFLANVIADHASERAKLLDRIQHPEVRQVEPYREAIVHEPPGDPSEMAFIGQEVPEFVNVGTED